ncbi:hypothetical protein C3433_05915 [Citrobacter freundii]|uniref:Uncharacterized protein n=1 Tax=Citrobacter arsenatis TaxID=2546350 RepID=A0A4P6WMS0_9ENTR|nr:hypothetical protein C3433_05915 [Citrobacter freundii]QBM24829.1 hypothetical protein E1B03_21280 [Citrobacter arsenatis]
MDGHGVLPNKSGCRVTFTASGGEFGETLSVGLISEGPSGNKCRMAANALSGLRILKRDGT